MHHGLAQLLGIALALAVALVQLVGRAIVLHHGGMLHRQIRHALLEIVDTSIVWRWNTLPDTTRAQPGWITRRAIAAGNFISPVRPSRS